MKYAAAMDSGVMNQGIKKLMGGLKDIQRACRSHKRTFILVYFPKVGLCDLHAVLGVCVTAGPCACKYPPPQ
jgi:hypothetical protein